MASETTRDDNDDEWLVRNNNLAYLINEVFHSWIIETVENFSTLMSYMPFMRPVIKELYTMELNGDMKGAAHVFFQRLKEVDEFGKYQCFLDALKAAKYDIVVEVLQNCNKDYNDEENKQVISLFESSIIKIIDPGFVVEALQQKDVLSSQEAEHVRNIARGHSQEVAVRILLSYIPHHQKDWYKIFLFQLWDCGYKKLVNEIDPKFYLEQNQKSASEHFSLDVPSFGSEQSAPEHSSLDVTSFGNEQSAQASPTLTQERSAREGAAVAHIVEDKDSVLKELADLKSLVEQHFTVLSTKVETIDLKVSRLEKNLSQLTMAIQNSTN